ncbi:MAG TPA: hypothetical protein VLA00_13040 [Xanthobacteraceae bacterium]|nr:hypothetical protein [Xanthobacteraceae bacterium]
MFRVLNLISLVALLAAAGLVYQLKYSSTSEAQSISRLRGEIRAERDRIAMLNAEWARRTAPDRIQALAERHLDMLSLDVEHMDTLASLPGRPEQQPDALGGMIEALVDGPLVTGTPGRTEKLSLEKLLLDKPAEKSPAKTAPIAVQSAPRPALRLPQAPRPPLPLDAMPPAGALATGRIGGAAPVAAQPFYSAPLTSSAPMLPPASVGAGASGSLR